MKEKKDKLLNLYRMFLHDFLKAISGKCPFEDIPNMKDEMDGLIDKIYKLEKEIDNDEVRKSKLN